MRLSSVKGFLDVRPWIAELVAMVGFLYFSAQVARFGITQQSVLDEGLYLYKGLIFASGKYFPFQDYGPWTNQMPFSYLIPGALQLIFGPGLRTGRIFSFIFALLMLLALWLTARRLSSRWLAACVVWIMAINPALARYYSPAVSQGLVACLLMWTMFLTLGPDRKMWQLILGTILASVTIMVRINMLPLLPLLILYISWQHGLKVGLWTAVAGIGSLAIFHTFYWPGILRMWAYWLPRSVVPFLKPWQLPEGAKSFWNPQVTFDQQLESFFQLARSHFAGLVGALAAWLLWPRRNDWKAKADLKVAVFLSALMLTLVALHFWAALGNEYCTYCFAGYNAFFIGLAPLLIVVTIRLWQKSPSLARKMLIILTILVLFAGISFSASSISGAVIRIETINRLLKLEVPRFNHMRFQPGLAELQQVLANVIPVDYYDIPRDILLYSPLITGLIAGSLFLGLTALAKMFSNRWAVVKSMAYSVFALWLFWGVGIVLIPTDILGNGYKPYDCTGNVITAFERSGKYLAETLPSGAQVYWFGYSPVNLLYVPDVKIYPSQLNIHYSLSTGGDSDALLRYGWWDNTSSNKWLQDTDYVLIEQRYLKRGGDIAAVLFSGRYEELPPAPSTAACLDDSYIRIFRRIP
jgi:hypothetical protein